MPPEIFMKPDYDAIIEKDLDMKPDDKVIMKIEPEDRSYDYYDDSNNFSFVHNEVGSKTIASKSLESSNNVNVPSPPATVQPGVIKAEPEDWSYDYYDDSNNISFVQSEVGPKTIVSKNLESSNNLNVPSPPSTVQPGDLTAEPDTVLVEKLTNIKSECDLDFIFEEIDISEHIKPYLLPVVPNVETGNENLKECDLPLDTRHDHTYVKQPEHVLPEPELDNSFDSDEVDVTEVDEDFSTLFRDECKKKTKRQQGSKSPALNDIQQKKNLAEKARRKMKTNLMTNLRLLVPAVSKSPKATEFKILFSSREYIDELEQNLKTKLAAIKILRNKQRSLVKEIKNLIKELENHSLNSR